MEELKNNNLEEQPVNEEKVNKEKVNKESVNEEPVIEQRPSTKYGRTAYQQQLKEEQEAQRKAEQVQAYQEHVNAYESFQQNTWDNQRAYTSYEEPKTSIKKTYAIILMVLIAISGMIAFISNVMAAEAYAMGDTLEEVMDAIFAIASQPGYQVLTTISDTVFFAMVGFFIMDISQIKKAGMKTKGAILFAIFLRPAYFIWRAHLLGEKKTIPIVYTVILYTVTFAELYIVMQGAMEMVMRTMY